MFIHLRREDKDISPLLGLCCLLNINLETKIMCLSVAAQKRLSSFDIDIHFVRGCSQGRNFFDPQVGIESKEKCLGD
jgi:hypothetical protein